MRRKRFNPKEFLVQHLNIHSEEKPFGCES